MGRGSGRIAADGLAAPGAGVLSEHFLHCSSDRRQASAGPWVRFLTNASYERSAGPCGRRPWREASAARGTLDREHREHTDGGPEQALLSDVYGVGVRITIDDLGSYSSLSYLRPN